MSFGMKKKQKKLFQILPFYNVLIKKPKTKHLSNIQLLHELPFYDELSVVEITNAFKGYARSYKVEILEPIDPLVQLEASKSSIEDLFQDLLNEMKGFKYQTTVATLSSKKKKEKENEGIEYTAVYFNSGTKTVINFDKYDLQKSFHEVLYRIDNWINARFGWIVESINGEYVNISIHSPLVGGT